MKNRKSDVVFRFTIAGIMMIQMDLGGVGERMEPLYVSNEREQLKASFKKNELSVKVLLCVRVGSRLTPSLKINSDKLLSYILNFVGSFCVFWTCASFVPVLKHTAT